MMILGRPDTGEELASQFYTQDNEDFISIENEDSSPANEDRFEQ